MFALLQALALNYAKQSSVAKAKLQEKRSPEKHLHSGVPPTRGSQGAPGSSVDLASACPSRILHLKSGGPTQFVTKMSMTSRCPVEIHV